MSATVLIVDDDPGARSLTHDVLEQAGYRPVEASTGAEALKAAERHRPGVVILDVEMPGMSGYELCRRLRSGFGNELGIIFLSGSRVETFDRVAGLHLGGDDYLQKPFAAEELVARVEALLRRLPPERESDGSFDLTSRELEVLGLLASGLRQGEIAERLVVTPKTVGKHIERILRKLGVHSRAEAVAVAYRSHVLDSDGSALE